MLGFGGVFMRGSSSLSALASSSPARSGSWSLVNWGSLVCFSSVLVLTTMCACALTWFSFLERLLSRQRKAQSYIGNPGTQTAESHFLGSRVNPGLVNFVWNVWLLFFPAPPVSFLSVSVSLGHFPKKSNTDMNTGRLQLLFPQCTQYINIPSSFIGRAGW